MLRKQGEVRHGKHWNRKWCTYQIEAHCTTVVQGSVPKNMMTLTAAMSKHPVDLSEEGAAG